MPGPRRNPYRILLVYFFNHALLFTAFAQEDTSLNDRKQRSVFSIGAGVQRGFIFAHSPAVENTKGAHPAGVELEFSWQQNDARSWDLCRCFPRNGFFLAYYDYDTEILGKGITAAYFLEPSYRIGKNMHFSLKVAAGLSWLNSPFDSIHNPTNMSYSTRISGYLQVGLGVWFRVSDHWWLNASGKYQHISNGGLKEPNKGINWPTAGITLHYQPQPRPYYRGVRRKEKFWKTMPVRWDASVFGIAKRGLDEQGESRRLLLLGLAFQGSKQVGSINALTAGVEIFTDRALKMKLQQDSSGASATRAGLLAGHEFLLGKFIFSQRIGVYVFNQTPYFDALYHRWGIQYAINRNWGAGFHLQAHRQVADFIDLRVSYSWRKKKN